MDGHEVYAGANVKVVFIADFFLEHIVGGAELNDDVLISGLEAKGIEIEKIRCVDLSEEDVIANDLFIVSNFTSLSERLKNILMLKKYIIYEHDHKYITTRDPSKFAKFNVPKSEIINREFYEKAHRAVVLSKICKEILEKTLDINNVDSIGCSLWTAAKLDYIESICETPKTKENFIINSQNPIKGTRQAAQFCKQTNLQFDLIGPSPHEELLKQMSEFNSFTFAPQVLETMSRVVVESKMLGCKVFTNRSLIGACYEDWYSLNGRDLIDKMRQKKADAIDLFHSLLQDNSITVILNCYRRPENLEEQIASIKNQTVDVDQVWVWVNYHEDNDGVDFSQFDCDKVIRNDFNWKFYGRFAGALLSSSKYVAMFDDDTIPGSEWLENCLQTMKTSEGILGGAGVILDGSKYTGHKRFGWSSQNEDTVEVDLVGHAWFFKREWLKYLWMEKPFTWDNGEDIQFSYCCQKYGGIKTYCPPHPKSNLNMFSSLKGYQLGVDEKATSRSRNHSVFYAQRDACVKNAIMNGWIPVQMAMAKLHFSSSKYWESRYALGGNSGEGSYGAYCDFKTDVMNKFLIENNIESVVEFGCGDGNQLSKINYKNYVGFDVSHTAIDLCKSKFKNSNHRFTNSISELPDSSDCTISLDVLYHLVEDEVYRQHLMDLFEKSSNYVVIFSSDYESTEGRLHMRRRHFTKDVKSMFPNYKMCETIKSPPELNNPANFYFFKKQELK